MGLTAPIIFNGLSSTPGAAQPISPLQGTYDFNTLQIPCDHQQHAERYQVNQLDLRTLQYVANPSINMRGPINGTAVVEVLIHGEPIEQDDPTYGYQILPDPNRLQIPMGPDGQTETFYKIVFNKEVRLVRPLIEVNYITVQTYCLKCNGTGKLNDFTQNTNGSILRIYGLFKLSQNALKFVLTSQCAFYPQFTCPIKTYIGRKFGISLTDADIANAVISALQNLQNIQTAQNAFQTLQPEETLQSFTNISATQDPTDPTVVYVSGVLLSYTSSNMNTTVSTPLNFTIQVTP
jgi:hypothetical protein